MDPQYLFWGYVAEHADLSLGRRVQRLRYEKPAGGLQKMKIKFEQSTTFRTGTPDGWPCCNAQMSALGVVKEHMPFVLSLHGYLLHSRVHSSRQIDLDHFLSIKHPKS
jgi:hypothetical protein